MKEDRKTSAQQRLRELLQLQSELIEQFGEEDYNVFVFGSYISTAYLEGKSDVDIAVYTEDFEKYKKIALYMEGFFSERCVPTDIFYIDLTMVSPIFCAPLGSQVQFTDFYPEKLQEFRRSCQAQLEENKRKVSRNHCGEQQ